MITLPAACAEAGMQAISAKIARAAMLAAPELTGSERFGRQQGILHMISGPQHSELVWLEALSRWQGVCGGVVLPRLEYSTTECADKQRYNGTVF